MASRFIPSTIRRDVPIGKVFWLYLGGYGVIRFAVQFFRGDDADHLVMGLAHSQYTAVAMVILAVVMLRATRSPCHGRGDG